MSTANVKQPVVLLDLDNTILDFNTAERVALRRALGELGLPVRILSMISGAQKYTPPLTAPSFRQLTIVAGPLYPTIPPAPAMLPFLAQEMVP